MKLLLITLAVLIITSCGQNSRTKENGNSSNQLTTQKGIVTISETKDFISASCAVIISPTDQQIDSMKKVHGEDFYTIADDNLFYIARARAYSDSLKTKTIEKMAMGPVRFKLKNGEIVDVNLSKLYWKVLLFNGQEKPIQADILDFNSEFDKYMKIKK